MIKGYRKGLVGIANWDMGQKNTDDKYYSRIDPGFYKKHLKYVLKQYKHRCVAAEWQIESYYHDQNNNSWPKMTDADLYKVDNFKYFLLKNLFWSLHLRAYGCDISSIHDGHRNWAINEHRSGIDFAFRMGMNAITFHPGSYHERINQDDPYIDFKVSWDEAIRTHDLRAESLKKGIIDIVRHFVSRIEPHEIEIQSYMQNNKTVTKSLDDIFNRLQRGRTDRHDELTNVEKITLISRAFEIISTKHVPIRVVRKLLLPDCATHLCIENVEPYNFLLNLPSQMEYWFGFIRERYHHECLSQSLSEDFVNKYRPMTIIDCNHFINSQHILKANPQLQELLGDSYNDCYRDFARIPGYYGNNEPLLNRLIRKNRQDILYWHISGLIDNSEFLLTHEPIKPFRTQLQTLSINDELTFTYQLGNHKSMNESDLETIIQLIGMDEIFILEIFNTATENIKNSWENVTSFIKYIRALKKYASQKILSAKPNINISNCHFAEVPIAGNTCGIKEFIFYRYSDKSPYYEIVSRFSAVSPVK